MASGISPFIIDADLHGLVDGHIEADRRTDVLRRIAGSPADRARVESWQKQTDLLRSAFAGLDREPIPVMLDLTARPRLQCIPENDALLAVDSVQAVGDRPQRARGRFRRLGLATALIAVLAAGLGASWILAGSGDPDDTVVTAKLRGSVDVTLATRASAAISRSATDPSPTRLREGDRLPTTEIPDLRSAGFSFMGAEIEASDPASILFRYQNGTSDRLVVCVAYAAPEKGATAAPVRIGDAVSWRKRDHAFSIAGTLRPGRLRAIALALQNDPKN